MTSRDLILDAWIGISRQLRRTLLCALGTVVAVAAIVSTDGLTHSANGAVSSEFNVLDATTVEFVAPGNTLTSAGVSRVDRLNGVKSAGLIWDLADGQPVPVGVSPNALASQLEGGNVEGAADLTFLAAAPNSFKALGASLKTGRFYDQGAGRHSQMVAVLGEGAARSLGISSTAESPAIFVGQSALTVVGIVGASKNENQALDGVYVPPYVARVIGGASSQRRVVVRTALGAAQEIGSEGPYALAPYSPGRVSAEVPPSPMTLRAHVEASLTSLLRLMGWVGLAIGFLAITTVTTVSVGERRSEIGLRRALGYQRLDIGKVILAEAIGIGALGSATGLAVGVLVTSFASQSEGWTPVLDLKTAAAAPLLGLAIGGLAGIGPAIRAMKITPLAALRSN